MNGTKAYKKTITNKQYQKYPKTFLSQESYLNDYGEVTQQSQNSDDSYFNQLMNEEA